MTATAGALLAVSLAAGALGGLTGFGFNVLAMPFYVLWLPGRSAVPVGAIVGIAAYAALLLDHRVRSDPDRSALVPAVAAALCGIPLGVLLLSALSRESLRVAVGAAVIVCGLLVWKVTVWRPAQRRGVVLVVGLLSGVMSSSTSLNGPPMAALLRARNSSAPALRATVGMFVLIVSAASAAALIAVGRLDAVGSWQIVGLAAVAVAGVILGSRLAPRLVGKHLRLLVQVLILASGTTCILTAGR